MNEKMIYEQTIASKLETLPLPDMADAIWARIEAQLDLDLPTDDSTGGNTPNFPTGGIILGGVGIIFITVLYLLFIQTNKKSNTPVVIPDSSLAPRSQPLSTPSAAPPRTKSQNNTLPANPLPTQANATVPFPVADSSYTTSLPSPVVADSMTLPNPAGLPAAVMQQKPDTITATKKGRGVTGLTADDFRIVPKKDSSKRN